VANAIELKQLLGEPVPATMHPEMLKRYPALKMAVPVKPKTSVVTAVPKG
jgi:hypothetical protein